MNNGKRAEVGDICLSERLADIPHRQTPTKSCKIQQNQSEKLDTMNLQQREAVLPQRDRATRCVSQKLASCCITVSEELVQVQNKSK